MEPLRDSPPPAPFLALIEADASLGRAITRLLALEGFETRAFRSATEAFANADVACARCLVVDVMLTGVDGLALLDRAAALGLNVPVILIAAADDDRLGRRVKNAANARVIDKPLDAGALLAAVRAALRRDT